MDLTTRYLGLTLASPLVPSASPLSDEVGNVRRMEDLGAGAVVLRSLFEEQIRRDRAELHHHLSFGTDSFAEAQSFFPEPAGFAIGPDGYLEHIRQVKAAVSIPVIASLNGSHPGKWTQYARLMQDAGADAVELNLYGIPTDVEKGAERVEDELLDVVRAVRAEVGVPLAVKLSPFFTNLANVALRLAGAGADGLTLFNRFYQPDIDLDHLEVRPNVLLSTPQALRLPLRWIAILYGRVKVDFAATSGIHSHEDVLKVLMVGASVAELCSVLMRHGLDHLTEVRRGLVEWMTAHEYESVRQMQGSMSQQHVESPEAFERAQYMRAVQRSPVFMV
ncbi:MAG: dihydroorotate dehydrogenase-like protein [Deltaproteobacteria bacterium]|nr:dihydroorotate dehydrogenase-like protein [Deltaproteobacteria bacterium]